MLSQRLLWAVLGWSCLLGTQTTFSSASVERDQFYHISPSEIRYAEGHLYALYGTLCEIIPILNRAKHKGEEVYFSWNSTKRGIGFLSEMQTLTDAIYSCQMNKKELIYLFQTDKNIIETLEELIETLVNLFAEITVDEKGIIQLRRCYVYKLTDLGNKLTPHCNNYINRGMEIELQDQRSIDVPYLSGEDLARIERLINIMRKCYDRSKPWLYQTEEKFDRTSNGRRSPF